MTETLIAALMFSGGSILGLYWMIKFVRHRPKLPLHQLWPRRRVMHWVLNFALSAVPTAVLMALIPRQLGMLLFIIHPAFMLVGSRLFRSSLDPIPREWVLSFASALPGLIFYVLHHQLTVSARLHPSLSIDGAKSGPESRPVGSGAPPARHPIDPQYVEMAENGATPQEVYLAVSKATGNHLLGIPVICGLFNLELSQAKEVMVQATGVATSLEAHLDGLMADSSPEVEPSPLGRSDSFATRLLKWLKTWFRRRV